MSDSLAGAIAAQDKLSRKMSEVSVNSKAAESSLAAVKSESSGLGSAMKKLSGTVMEYIDVGKIKDFAAGSMEAFRTYEKGIQGLGAMIPAASGKDLEVMDRQVKEFAVDNARLSSEVIPALYNALAAGIPNDNVFDFLESADKLSVGGLTGLNDSAALLADITKQYRFANLDAGEAADLMFETVKNGKTTIPELAASLGKVVPEAAASKVAFSDVAAAMGAMTDTMGTGSAQKAAEGLGSMLRELSAEGSGVDGIFRGIAGKSFKDFIAGGGTMQQAISALARHAETSGISVEGMFSSIEAGEAAMVLGGSGAESFIQNMDTMKTAAGASDEAYSEMTDGYGRKIDQINSLWENTKLDVGAKLAEAVSPGLDSLTENFDLIKQPLTEFFGTVGDIAATVIPLLPPVLGALGSGFKSVWNLGKPLFDWLKNNPETFRAVLSGIGTAIVSHNVVGGLKKVSEGIKDVGSALLKNPWGMLASVVVTGISAIATAAAENEKKLRQADLEKHFGSVALSMEEVENAASHIVQTDNLGRLKESLGALGELDGIQSSIDSSIKNIDKMNWKVSIGLALSEDEKELYMSEMTSYVASVQEYAGQQQYAVTLTVGILTEGSLESSNIVSQLNDFYNGKQKELAALGTELNNVVTDAFSDGLLDIDEVKEITEIQEKMAKIQSVLAGTNYDAKLDLLKVKYGGGLDAESFQNLQAELETQRVEAMADYEKAFTLGMANARVMLEEGTTVTMPDGSEKKFDQTMYDTAVSELEAGYRRQAEELALKTSKFQLDMIGGNYSDAVVPGEDKLMQLITGGLDKMLKDPEGVVGQDLYNLLADLGNQKYIDNTASKDNIGEMLAFMQPLMEEIEGFEKAYLQDGGELPADLKNILLSFNKLEALNLDKDALMAVVADTIKGDESYVELLGLIKERNGGIMVEPFDEILMEKNPPLRLDPMSGSVYPQKPLDVSKYGVIPGLGTVVRETRNEENVNITIDCNGKIEVPKGLSKNDVVELISANLKPQFLKLLREDNLEEGDRSYAY